MATNKICLNVDGRPFARAIRLHQETLQKLGRVQEANRILREILKAPKDYSELVIGPNNCATLQANSSFLDDIVEVRNELYDEGLD